MSTSNPRYLSITETCTKIGKTRWTVRRLRNNGTLVAKKLGAARNAEVRISEDSVNAYLAGRPDQPAAGGT